MFRRRRDWFQHELDVHRTYWECPRGCLELLSNTNDFESHMLDLHQSQFTQEQFQSLSKALSKQQDGRHKTSCWLCGKEHLVNETLRRHLGGEMEENALFVMPRRHDFWDGSDESSDTDTSDSSDGLSEEATLSRKSKAEVEAYTARLVDTNWKEAESSAGISSDLLKQKNVDSDVLQLGVEDTLDSTKQSALPTATKDVKRDVPTNAAVETDFSNLETEFWIPEDLSDVNVDASFHEESNNIAHDFESPARNPTNIIKPPAAAELYGPNNGLIGDCTPQELYFVSMPEDNIHAERLTAINPAVRPAGTDVGSPGVAYRAEYGENFATEFGQFHHGKSGISDSGSERAPEDTSPYHQEGVNRLFGQFQEPRGSERPSSKSPREDPPPSSFSCGPLAVASPPLLAIAHAFLGRSKLPPSSGRSPRGLLPSGESDADLSPASDHRTPGMHPSTPPAPFAASAFRCTHPGCTAAPFQTQYLLNAHSHVHSSSRPHFCPVKDCPRGVGGKGFNRKNEMIRHGLAHNSPGYTCPFCPDQQHTYPRPDNLQRYAVLFVKIDGFTC